MGSGNKGRDESALQAQAAAAAARAAEAEKKVTEIDPFEQMQRDFTMKLWNWREGKDEQGNAQPLDLRKMPGGQVPIALYNDARVSKDAGRVGKGYATLGDGANPNFSRALDEELQFERDQEASGALENYVGGTLGALDDKMTGLSRSSDNRDIAGAQIASGNSRDAYSNFFNYRQTKQPSFLKSLALGLASGASVGARGAWSI